MPLIMLTDNGSTEEDLPAMKMAKVYGIPMIVFDHHHPDEIVDQFCENFDFDGCNLHVAKE